MLSWVRTIPAWLALLVGVLSGSLVIAPVAHAMVTGPPLSSFFNRPSSGLPMTLDPYGTGGGGVPGAPLPIRLTPASMMRPVPPANANPGGAFGARTAAKWAAGSTAAAGLSAGLILAFNDSMYPDGRPNDGAGQGPQIDTLDDPAFIDYAYGDPDRIQEGRGFPNSEVEEWVRNAMSDRCGYHLTPANGMSNDSTGTVVYMRSLLADTLIRVRIGVYESCTEYFDGRSALRPTPHSSQGNMLQNTYCVRATDMTQVRNATRYISWNAGMTEDVYSFNCGSGWLPYYVDITFPAYRGGEAATGHRTAGGVYVFEGHQARFDAMVRDQTRAGVEVTCRNGQGDTTTRTGYSDSGPGSDMRPVMPQCPEGYFPVAARNFLDQGLLGEMTTGEFEIDPGFIEAYPQCVGPAAMLCNMQVLLDNLPCDVSRGECADWYRHGLQNPERVRCEWGPYVLPWPECMGASHVFGTGNGVVESRTDYPANYPPQPVDPATGTVPATYPGSPGNQPDPRYDAREHGCSAFSWGGVPFRVSPAGLQPVASYGLRCVIEEFPELQFTSGFRTSNHVPDSGHPRGLSTDISHPDWAAENGRTYLWDVATWLVTNAGWLQIAHVIWDKSIWTPQHGWRPYTYSGGPATGHDADHTNHIDIRWGLANHNGTVPVPNPYAPPSPDPRPAPPRNPPESPPRTVPPTTTDPVIPPTGDNPDPGDGSGDCMGDAWGWNPVNWVYVPVKCATLWAFTPSLDFGDELDDRMDTFGGTGVGGWLMAPVTVGNEIASLSGSPVPVSGPVQVHARQEELMPFTVPAEEPHTVGGVSESMFPALRSGTAPPPVQGFSEVPLVLAGDGVAAAGMTPHWFSGCQGPALTVDLGRWGGGERTIYPASACSSPMSTIASIVRVGLAVMINATVVLALPRMVMAVMGFRKEVEDVKGARA